MIDINVNVGDLVTWSHPIASDAGTGELGVVVQIEDCDDVEEFTGEVAPSRVWVLWNGKTKMAWTLPEMLKRIDLPIYLPLLSLVACFLIIKSKESENYTKLKFLLFSMGIIIIIFSKLSIKFASTNQIAFLAFLLIPCLIFYLTFNIFKTKANKI